MWKKLLTAVLAFTISAGLVLTAQAAVWRQDQYGWWYDNENGTHMHEGWFQDYTGSWYYAYSDGYIATDGYTPDGYYVDASGVWVQSVARRMFTGTYEYGYTLNAPSGENYRSGRLGVVLWQRDEDHVELTCAYDYGGDAPDTVMVVGERFEGNTFAYPVSEWRDGVEYSSLRLFSLEDGGDTLIIHGNGDGEDYYFRH